MTSSAERKLSEWDTGTMCKDCHLYRHLWIRCVMQEIKWCMYSRDELFLSSLKCYFGVYFPHCFATREINTKITLLWALKQFITQLHTLFSIYWLAVHTFSLCKMINIIIISFMCWIFFWRKSGHKNTCICFSVILTQIWHWQFQSFMEDKLLVILHHFFYWGGGCHW